MSLKYSEIIEAVQSLKYEDKIKLKDFINQNLIAERREVIFQNYKTSKKEVETGKVKYHKTSKELKETIENSVD